MGVKFRTDKGQNVQIKTRHYLTERELPFAEVRRAYSIVPGGQTQAGCNTVSHWSGAAVTDCNRIPCELQASALLHGVIPLGNNVTTQGDTQLPHAPVNQTHTNQSGAR
ncbi:hypothetical protein Bbelb_402790 [Branchiostoma belcheri]|nr:hypothetical protein Bbelb_402790 [Branchiostoma belcheri]